MAFTLRRLLAGRLLGMAFEGFLTWMILAVLGVPMALVLGLIAAILAFIPNVGAFITGAGPKAARLVACAHTPRSGPFLVRWRWRSPASARQIGRASCRESVGPNV